MCAIQNLLLLKFSVAYLGYTVNYKFLLLYKIKISVFLISTTVEGSGEKFFTTGICDSQKEGEGRR